MPVPAVGEHSCAHTPKRFKSPPRIHLASRSKAKTHCSHFIFQQQQFGIAEGEMGKKKNWQVRVGMGNTHENINGKQ